MNDRHLLEAVSGSFSPLRLHMKLSGGPGDYLQDHASLESLGTWVHERTHFHQTIFTGYGQICWDSQRQMTGYLVNQWESMPLLKSGKRGLPLAHAGRESLQAQTLGLLTRETCREWIALMQARHACARPEGVLSDLNLKLLDKPWKINPSIQVGGANYTLEGKDILEGHALFVEATLLEHLGIEREEIWNRSALRKCYWVARDWFVEQIGSDRYTDFPFVCDLALQTSRRPEIPTTQEEWEASSPPWRFMRLTEVLKQEAGLTVGEPAEWMSNYEAFAQTLLERCGYKPLHQVFDERLEALKRRPRMMELEKLLERAIAFRGRNPWCNGNPVADQDLWTEMQQALPAPLVQIAGRIGNHSSLDQALNNEIVMELQFQALASQILGEFSNDARQDRVVECAFKKFGIPNGCEFQNTHGCQGSYRPADGPPHPVIEADGVVRGCSFEALLLLSGHPSASIDLDPTADFPDLDEIEQTLAKGGPM